MTASEALSARGVDYCRGCESPGLESVLDLGSQPLANSLLREQNDPEESYPLHLRICRVCGLGQVGEYASPDAIFSDYPYLSSMSSSWLGHVANYARRMIDRLHLGGDDLVVEVASNDGHLLREFQRAGVPVHGVEPARNISALAEQAGVPTTCAFFGLETAQDLVRDQGRPRLVAANNVLAHVPDINDFMAGLAHLCGPETVVTVENPTFTGLLRGGLFDTIYHEHFSYLSGHAVSRLGARHGLRLVDVDMLDTHGGSYRYVLARADESDVMPGVERALTAEERDGLLDPTAWKEFAQASAQTIALFREWLDGGRRSGRTVVGYGAPAKGNTLLNAAGATPDDLSFVTDRSPEKQGRFLPGSRIPVRSPDALRSSGATDVIVLPWNIGPELSAEVSLLSDARQWVVVPRPTRLDER